MRNRLSSVNQPAIHKFSRLICIIMVCAVVYGTVNAHASATLSLEYKLKAVLLYNFAKFVEWPDGAFADGNTPLTIGILGEDPFGNIFEQAIKGKTVKSRKLKIKRFKQVRDVDTCHILFISSSEEKHLTEVLEFLKDSDFLTVGEMKQFAHSGGIINFIIEESKIRFEINIDAASRTQLKISSKLLKLARIIRDRPPSKKD